MIGHSMGGLIIRGFAQQPDYESANNFMKGYIHRLITIGTPHFGAQLAGVLYQHRDDLFCFNGIIPIPAKYCQDPKELKFIYRKNFTPPIPIDDGGVKDLIPGSTAYSNLCPTNVSSYSIAGNWKPDGIQSHDNTMNLFRIITNNPKFSIEDSFQGENNLQVNLLSQAGGLNATIKDEGGNQSLPNESTTYQNTVHSKRYVADKGVDYELNSSEIKQDVITLLGSSTDKFARAIGNGSICNTLK